MNKIISVLDSVPSITRNNDDDFADRLVYKTSVGLFVLFAVVITTRQYVGDPIQCWVPAEFTGNHEEYTNNFCWIKNTYYLPYDKTIPKESESHQRNMINYYQWLPLILGIQALICYLPIMLWRYMNTKSGIDVSAIVEAGEKYACSGDNADWEKGLQHMTKNLDRYLANQRDVPSGCTISLKHLLSRTCFSWCGKRKGNYLICLYLITKILLFLAAFIQLFALNIFLGQDFHLFGLDFLTNALKGQDTNTNKFPKVTMCDFKIRRLGNIQRHTVQCVLPINLFSEKIYLFIWFWLVFVCTMMALSIASWTFKFIYTYDNRRYVKKHLQLFDKIRTEADKKLLVKFVDDYLRQDGLFVLRILGKNTNAITSTEFVCQLWDSYRCKPLCEKVDDVDTV